MQLPPLHRATLIRRYKRFLADVLFEDGRFEDGREETVHVPNPGAMLGLAEPGQTVWTSPGASKTRKLPQTLELVEVDGALVGVNTLLPNRLAAEALAEGRIPELAGYARIRREVKYGQASRIDFLLDDPEPATVRPGAWVEVKSVTLSRTPGLAEWPDCASARATRHLEELVARLREGDRAAVLFVVQRADCDRFAIAADLDPAFSAGLARAQAAGLEVLAYGCSMTLDAIILERAIPLAAGAPESRDR